MVAYDDVACCFLVDDGSVLSEGLKAGCDCADIALSHIAWVWLRLGNPAVVGEGIFLARAGFAYEISQDNLYVGAIHAIHDGTGDKKLSILELS